MTVDKYVPSRELLIPFRDLHQCLFDSLHHTAVNTSTASIVSLLPVKVQLHTMTHGFQTSPLVDMPHIPIVYSLNCHPGETKICFKLHNHINIATELILWCSSYQFISNELDLGSILWSLSKLAYLYMLFILHVTHPFNSAGQPKNE